MDSALYILIGISIGVGLMTFIRRLLHKANRQIWVKTITTELLVRIHNEIEEELKIRGEWQKG